MTPADIKAMLATLEPIVAMLATIGLPGMIGAVLSAPALVIIVMMIMGHFSTLRTERAQQRFQECMAELLEVYRQDTQQIQRDMAEKHAEVVSYYHKNVELVKNYERSTEALQTLVVNNTRAMERLTTIVETRGKQ